MRVISTIEKPETAAKILRAMGLPDQARWVEFDSGESEHLPRYFSARLLGEEQDQLYRCWILLMCH